MGRVFQVSALYSGDMKCDTPAITTSPRLAFRLSHQSTMGQALDTFRRARNLSQADLAAWLSIDEENLEKIAEMRRPEPNESDFHLQCEAIAGSMSGDAFALRTLLRWLRIHG
jgi:DNA-binding transcriptional regulator YiaG